MKTSVSFSEYDCWCHCNLVLLHFFVKTLLYNRNSVRLSSIQRLLIQSILWNGIGVCLIETAHKVMATRIILLISI
ncbi:hypothetical protein AQUCO_03300116v1 [Aquilegia coerulea]|uniref:Uncharacterized protein n=1 Tax=Aquilegia coerulea TaxID=218851 RepID=A0A2G5CZK1_AQUCA|nr:hypothetical protein AQUCO_03300116v1 [Aquilegia coerulea]